MTICSRGAAATLLVILAYFAILVPYSGSPILYYPDERHYAYSASQMVEGGDWLIPRTPDNEIRLKKPILPYWLAAAGFELAGIGVFGFRLFWVLSACATLGLTYALGRTLRASQSEAFLAMLLTAANPLVFRGAVQSIPDMPLTLFMMLQTLGFTRILTGTDTPPRSAGWLAWIGTALAILTKGILPLIFALFVIGFAALSARGRVKHLLAPLPVLAAVLLVLSWYVYAATYYPAEFFGQFFGDQVTEKVAFDPLRILGQFPAYFASGLGSLFLLPLILLVAWWRSPGRRSGETAIATWPPAIKMLALWSLAVPVMFSVGPFVAGRYLLPVIPIVAVLTVLGFSALDAKGNLLGRASGWLLIAVAVLELPLFALGAAIEWQLAPVWEACLFTALAAAIVWKTIAAVRSPVRAPYVSTAVAILSLSLVFAPIARLFLPNVAQHLAARLAAEPPGPTQPLLVGPRELIMYTRLIMGKAAAYRESRVIPADGIGDACIVMTDREDLMQNLRARGFAIETFRGGYEKRLHGFWPALVSGRLAEARAQNSAIAYFATCKPG